MNQQNTKSCQVELSYHESRRASVVASAIKALASDAIRALAQQIGRKIDHDDVEVTTDLVVLREPTLDINPDNSVHSVYGLGRLLVTATLR